MMIRPAEPGDEMAVAGVHVRSWQAAYRTLLPDEYLDQLRPEDRAPKYDFASRDPGAPQTIVATEGSQVYGFATTAPSRDSELPEHGELCALYVDPTHWGRGAGAALIEAARARIAGMRYEHAYLWLLTGNVRGERFYRKDGWAPDGRRRTDSVWGVSVEEIRYVRNLMD